MIQIAVASGKGGTGKTSILSSFASFANAVLADCDVDAPNLHLILRPEIKKEIPYEGMEVAEIDEEKCIKCGECEKACRFNAIKNLVIIKERCEGCGVCQLVCPVNAIEMRKRITGFVNVANSRFGGFAYGLLLAGEEASGKLVNQVRKKALEIAEGEEKNIILIDSPAGIGCPVIASIGNTNLVIVVTEPTTSAIHDMKRLIEMAKHFKVRTFVVINKYDINKEMVEEIEEFCLNEGIKIVGKIPFDKKFTEAMVNGKSVVEYDEKLAELMKRIWNEIENELR
ncbi:MAG TPA: (4Fe-4S)-binding protein [Thermoplasmatales archaeon]|nr:(4Fe-4S)-binding protein [Thermoplasmatales archaeon]